MATYFVSSVDGNNADDGLSWANAKATVAGALAVATTAGDVIKVDSAHNYVAVGAITWTPSTDGQVSIISVNRAGSDAPLAGAVEDCGATASGFAVSLNRGTLYVQGMTLKGGSSAAGSPSSSFPSGASEGGSLTFNGCTFVMQNPQAAGHLIVGGTSYGGGARHGYVEFLGCTFTQTSPSSSAAAFNLGLIEAWFVGCTLSLASGSAPTYIVETSSTDTAGMTYHFVDCDFSAYNSTLIEAGKMWGHCEFVNCKMHASTSLVPAGTWPNADRGSITMVNIDSGDTTYKFAHHTREGALTIDTSIYADSGAEVDANPLSWKIATTSLCNERRPFVTPWLSVWIDTTGSTPLSLEMVWDSASDFTDREVWAEFEYLGNASYPVGTVVSTRNAGPFVSTGADLTNSAQAWTGTGGMSNSNEQSITQTVTVNQKGLARVRLYVAKASTTLYVDPQLRTA